MAPRPPAARFRAEADVAGDGEVLPEQGSKYCVGVGALWCDCVCSACMFSIGVLLERHNKTIVIITSSANMMSGASVWRLYGPRRGR